MLITEHLDKIADKFKEKIAFADENKTLTYGELQLESYQIASALITAGFFKSPVAIFLEKSVECVVAFMGALYSGNFYTLLDTKMPSARIDKILTTFQPKALITDTEHLEQVKAFVEDKNIEIIICNELRKQSIDVNAIREIGTRIIDTDISYVLYTSGSTGIPKGVIVSHKALIDFVDWGVTCFGIDDTYIFGNQTPLYFSMSVFDIYTTIRTGATMYIIPPQFFMMPAKLMQYMYDKKVNTIFWVPSALTFVAVLGALNTPHLQALKNVFFGGEAMPIKQLNKWIAEYPDVRYVNFYGPTEVTDTCTFYEVNRKFEDTDSLPMGNACRNMDVFLLDEKDNLVSDGEIGEVCVRGSGLASGYYNDIERTREAFVQNPLNRTYYETIYRTGDLAKKNEYGEFVYISRKDFQIKHQGRRIELGEIETALLSVDGVETGCCLYDAVKSRIVMFYTGNVQPEIVLVQLKELIPEYMMPNRHYHLEEMPFNLNGKVDREKLKKNYIEKRK